MKFKERTLYYHRLVWLLVNGGIPEGKELDHINGDRIDNRLDNLRLVDHRGNQQNQKKHRETDRLGYYWYKPTNKWNALIRINGKGVHLGYFSNENYAQKAYNIACELLDSYENNKQFRELVKNRL